MLFGCIHSIELPWQKKKPDCPEITQFMSLGWHFFARTSITRCTRLATSVQRATIVKMRFAFRHLKRTWPALSSLRQSTVTQSIVSVGKHPHTPPHARHGWHNFWTIPQRQHSNTQHTTWSNIGTPGTSTSTPTQSSTQSSTQSPTHQHINTASHQHTNTVTNTSYKKTAFLVWQLYILCWNARSFQTNYKFGTHCSPCKRHHSRPAYSRVDSAPRTLTEFCLIRDFSQSSGTGCVLICRRLGDEWQPASAGGPSLTHIHTLQDWS
jgi:hypothetical protein